MTGRSKNPRQGKTQGALLISSARTVTMLLQIVAVPYILKCLGQHDYGVVFFAISVTRYIAILDPGLSDGATLSLLRAFAPGSTADAGRLWRTSVVTIGLHYTVGGLLFAWIGSKLNLSEMSGVGNTSLVLGAAAFSWAFMNLAFANTVYMNARGEYKRLAINNVISAVVGTAASVVLVGVFRTPVAYLIGMALGPAVAFLAGAWHYRSDIIVRSGSFASWTVTKEFLSLGLRNYGNRIANVLSGTADRVLLGGAVSQSLLGHYQNCTRIPEALGDLTSSVGQTTQPELSKAFLAGPESFAKSVHRNTLIAFAIGVCFILVPTAYAAPILRLWLGERAYAGGANVMLGMGVYRSLEMYLGILGMTMFVAGKAAWALPFTLWNGLVRVILTIPMARWIGLEGVALMNVGIHACQVLPATWFVAKRVAPGVPLRPHIAKLLMISGIGAAFVTVGRMVSESSFVMRHPALCIVLVPATCAAAAIATFGLRLADTPEVIQQLLRRALRK